MTTETHAAATHPTLEELAAFIDGMLPESERARVMDHLASCRDCEEVFVETARFQLDHPEEVARRASVTPFPRERRALQRFPRWLALPAAALLAVALGWLGYRLLFPQAEPQLTTAQLLEPLDEAALAANTWNWPVYRSGGLPDDPLNENWTQASFRVGAYLVDWRVSLSASDASKVAEFSQRIANALQPLELMDEVAALFLKDWTDQPDTHQQTVQYLQEIRANAARREALVDAGTLSPAYLSFGKWTEAARLAALTEEPHFFEDRDNERFLIWLLEEEGQALQARSPEVAAALQEIRQRWEAAPQELDYDALGESLKQILRAYEQGALSQAGPPQAEPRSEERLPRIQRLPRPLALLHIP